MTLRSKWTLRSKTPGEERQDTTQVQGLSFRVRHEALNKKARKRNF